MIIEKVMMILFMIKTSYFMGLLTPNYSKIRSIVNKLHKYKATPRQIRIAIEKAEGYSPYLREAIKNVCDNPIKKTLLLGNYNLLAEEVTQRLPKTYSKSYQKKICLGKYIDSTGEILLHARNTSEILSIIKGKMNLYANALQDPKHKLHAETKGEPPLTTTEVTHIIFTPKHPALRTVQK